MLKKLKVLNSSYSKLYTILILLVINSTSLFTQDDVEWQRVWFNSGNICVDSDEWIPVFYDDFETEPIDSANWTTYFPPLNSVFSRANNPKENQQIYLKENVQIQNGILRLTVREQESSWMGITQPYSSGWITSINKYTTYSRFEARVKIPCEEGLVPAFWLFGWTTEIDIFEHLDGNPGRLKGSVHEFPVSKPGERETNTYDLFSSTSNYCEDFHTYAVEYSPFSIKFFIDEDLVLNFPRYYKLDGSAVHKDDCALIPGIYLEHPNFPRYGDPLQIIANIGVANGNFGGKPTSNSQFPASMQIDYISVSQLKSKSSLRKLQPIKIAPNPTSGSFSILGDRDDLSRIRKIKIIDFSGDLIRTISYDGKYTLEVDFSNESNGIYSILFFDDNGIRLSDFIFVKQE